MLNEICAIDSNNVKCDDNDNTATAIVSAGGDGDDHIGDYNYDDVPDYYNNDDDGDNNDENNNDNDKASCNQVPPHCEA